MLDSTRWDEKRTKSPTSLREAKRGRNDDDGERAWGAAADENEEKTFDHTHSQCACVWFRASISLFRTLAAAARYVAFAESGCPGTAPTSDSRALESSPLRDAASFGSSAGAGTTGDAPFPTAAAGLAGVITAMGARRRDTLPALRGLWSVRGAMVQMKRGRGSKVAKWEKGSRRWKKKSVSLVFVDGQKWP